MIKYQHLLAVMAIVCGQAFAVVPIGQEPGGGGGTGGTDNFLDIQNGEQVYAFNNEGFVGGQTGGISGWFMPRWYSLAPLDSQSGQQSQFHKIEITIGRRTLNGRVALIGSLYSPSSWYGRYGPISGAHFAVKQNGIMFYNLSFNSGSANGMGAEIVFNESNTPQPATNNSLARTVMIIGQTGGQSFNPLQAFDLYYVGHNLSDPNFVLSMPALPTVSAAFNPSTVVQGSQYTIQTQTVGAAELRMTCTGAAASNESLPVGLQAITRTATELGTSNCAFSATGHGGPASASAQRVVKPAPPTVSARFDRSSATWPMSYQVVASTTNATSLSMTCDNGGTSSLGTRSFSSSLPTGSTTTTMLVGLDHFGNYQCTFRAAGAGGTTQTNSSIYLVGKTTQQPPTR